MKTHNIENFGLGLRHASMSTIRSSNDFNTCRILDDNETVDTIKDLSNRIESPNDTIFAAKLFGESIIIGKSQISDTLFHNLVKDSQLKEQALIVGIMHHTNNRSKLKHAYRIKSHKIMSLNPKEFKEMKKVLSAIFA